MFIRPWKLELVWPNRRVNVLIVCQVNIKWTVGQERVRLFLFNVTNVKKSKHHAAVCPSSKNFASKSSKGSFNY